MKPAASRPLAGVGILVTRPAHQAAGLAQRISALGGTPLLFPGIEIEPLATGPLDLAGVDLAIFVSPNAVEHAADPIRTAGGLPAGARIAAIGPSTAAELGKRPWAGRANRPILMSDAGSDSEALLALLPAAEVNGCRVAIFRGAGGRALLGDTLRARGARVEYVETYRRSRPQGDMAALLSRWQAGQIGGSLATSAEIVANLFAMAGQAARWMRAAPMFVPHPKVAAAAFRLGVQSLVVAGNGDEALAAAMAAWFGRLRTGPATPTQP